MPRLDESAAAPDLYESYDISLTTDGQSDILFVIIMVEFQLAARKLVIL